MKLAFLDGVRWSRGDFNVRHKAATMKTMLGRAKKVGLEDPSKILCEELDAVKANLMLYEKRQQSILQGSGGRGMLMGDAEERGEEAEQEMLMTPRSGLLGEREAIVYEEDEDDY